MHRLIAVMVIVLALVGVTANAVAATLPPTLSNEQFLQQGSGSFELACNPDQTGTFTYLTSGIATGPYPGPFTESGTVTIGTDGTSFVVKALTATFEITSNAGHVTGTTVLDHPDLPYLVYCNGNTAAHSSAYARYTATIVTSGGSFTDAGTSYVVVEAGATFLTYINEVFSSSLPAVVPNAQCHDGVWQYPARFSSEGGPTPGWCVNPFTVHPFSGQP